MLRDRNQFDDKFANQLRRMWFLGDVHGKFSHIAKYLKHAREKPGWLVFLGDIDINTAPFSSFLEPLAQSSPSTRFAFIHGNHDADTFDHWAMLHDCGDAIALHGRVVDLDGIRVAGLGGNFLGRVWYPPGPKKFQSKDLAMNRGTFQWRNGQRPNPSLNGAIYPDDVVGFTEQNADILVTHEAPSCHEHGFAEIDNLARLLKVVRSFHGHQHDDCSSRYALAHEQLGFDASAVALRGIKNGLGEVIYLGEIDA
jgi:predicted phosphodiesterase